MKNKSRKPAFIGLGVRGWGFELVSSKFGYPYKRSLNISINVALFTISLGDKYPDSTLI